MQKAGGIVGLMTLADPGISGLQQFQFGAQFQKLCDKTKIKTHQNKKLGYGVSVGESFTYKIFYQAKQATTKKKEGALTRTTRPPEKEREGVSFAI